MEHILYVNKVKIRWLLPVFSDLRKTQKILEITLPKFLLHFSIIEESKVLSEGRYLFTLCWNFSQPLVSVEVLRKAYISQ